METKARQKASQCKPVAAGQGKRAVQQAVIMPIMKGLRRCLSGRYVICILSRSLQVALGSAKLFSLQHGFILMGFRTCFLLTGRGCRMPISCAACAMTLFVRARLQRLVVTRKSCRKPVSADDPRPECSSAETGMHQYGSQGAAAAERTSQGLFPRGNVIPPLLDAMGVQNLEASTMQTAPHLCARQSLDGWGLSKRCHRAPSAGQSKGRACESLSVRQAAQ